MYQSYLETCTDLSAPVMVRKRHKQYLLKLCMWPSSVYDFADLDKRIGWKRSSLTSSALNNSCFRKPSEKKLFWAVPLESGVEGNNGMHIDPLKLFFRGAQENAFWRKLTAVRAELPWTSRRVPALTESHTAKTMLFLCGRFTSY